MTIITISRDLEKCIGQCRFTAADPRTLKAA